MKISKVLETYNNLSVAVKSAFWFSFASVVQKGLAFITMPILTRLLTTAEYGNYNIFVSWMNIFIVFATLNLSSGVYNNGMVKYKDKQNEFTSSMQGLSFVTTLIFLALILLFEKQLCFYTRLCQLDFLLMVVYFLSFPPVQFWSAKERFDFRYKTLVLVSIGTALLTQCLSIVFVFSPVNNNYAIIFGLISAQLIVGSIIALVNWRKGHFFFSAIYWKYALCFNIPLIPHYLSGIVLGQSDRIMIANLVGKSEAGIYSLAYSISIVLSIITSSVNASFTPWAYLKLQLNNYKETHERAIDILMIFSFLTLALVLISPELILFLGSNKYYDAVYIIPSIALGNFFNLFYFLFVYVEFYYEKKSCILFASVFCALLNIVMNYYFIPIYGYMAAGYTTLVSYLVFAFMHVFFVNYIMKNGYNIKHPIKWLKLLLISVLSCVFCIAVIPIYSTPFIRYFILLALGLIAYIKRVKVKEMLAK